MVSSEGETSQTTHGMVSRESAKQHLAWYPVKVPPARKQKAWYPVKVPPARQQKAWYPVKVKPARQRMAWYQEKMPNNTWHGIKRKCQTTRGMASSEGATSQTPGMASRGSAKQHIVWYQAKVSK